MTIPTTKRVEDLRRNDMIWGQTAESTPAAWHRITQVIPLTSGRVWLGTAIDGFNFARGDLVRVFRPYVVRGGLSSSATAAATPPPAPSR